MFETNTRVHIRDPLHEDNLVPAVVLKCDGMRVSLRFLQAFWLTPDDAVTLFYYNHSNQFNSVSCRFHRMLTPGDNPVGTVTIDGEPASAETRSAYRVAVFDNVVSATINGSDMAEVLNISCNGIGVVLDREDIPAQEWIRVGVRYEKDVHEGKMQVRSITPMPDGRFRYGLLADESDPTLISQLTRITHHLQQIKARRASGLGNNRRSGAADNDADRCGLIQEKKIAEETPVSPDGTQRMHMRSPWPGKAKLYIREDQNIRVLTVETVDLSKGGLSFISQQFIYDNSEVLFEKPINGGFFRVCGVVRSSRIEDSGAHRVGVKFTSAPLKPGQNLPGFEQKFNAA